MDADERCRETVRAYFRAFRDRDRVTLERILAPKLIHRSPFGEHRDRDRMLDQVWPHPGPIWAEEVTVYGRAPEFLAHYRHGGASRGHLVERFVFDGERIVEIEVYLGVGALPTEGPEGGGPAG